jgi:hypothetical protein
VGALVLLAALELGLRLAGWQIVVSVPGDPFVNLLPLFEPARAAGGVAVLRRRSDPGVTFLAAKPANGFRVFVLGESSVHGDPYGPAYAFAAFLQQRLAAALPGARSRSSMRRRRPRAGTCGGGARWCGTRPTSCSSTRATTTSW